MSGRKKIIMTLFIIAAIGREKTCFFLLGSVHSAKQTSESERHTDTDKRAECK